MLTNITELKGLYYLVEIISINFYVIMCSFVASKLAKDDSSWIPKGVALSIPDSSTKDNEDSEQDVVFKLRYLIL